jgi:3-(3-hydroxy-phenyl)propionate hydroxylase
LAPWLNKDDGILWRQAGYRFHALVAEEWRSNRIFVAGDAAHQQPPFLGQGMCQGIRDAVNLSWRLNAVLKEGAAETLLNTYGIERKSHVVDLTNRIKAIGKLITERDVEKARARDAKLLAECGGVVKPTPRQDVQPALTAGLLGSISHPARGTIFPQALLNRPNGDTVRMDDLYPAGWRIFLRASASDDFGNASKHHHLSSISLLKLGSPAFAEAEGVLAQWFEKHDVQAAIVRPDHYIYAVCNTPQELSEELDALKLA